MRFQSRDIAGHYKPLDVDVYRLRGPHILFALCNRLMPRYSPFTGVICGSLEYPRDDVLVIIAHSHKNMNSKSTLLRIKWGTSRGVNTYGYTICSLYANGKKEISTNGGGYDMAGTVLAGYIKRYYLPRLLTLTGNHGSLDDGTGFYGLMFHDTVTGKWEKTYKEGYGVSLDGMCGWSSIERIANEIGLEIKRLEKDHYLLTDTR